MKTIVAISTPIGRGGIGIVRMSGDDAKNIASQIFFKKGLDFFARAAAAALNKLGLAAAPSAKRLVKRF